MGACDSILYTLCILCRSVVRLLSNLTMDNTRPTTYIMDIISHRGKILIPGRLRRVALSTVHVCTFVNQPCCIVDRE